MLVILTPSVFAPGEGGLSLLSIANHALHGRHRVIVADEIDPNYQNWIAELSRSHREEWDFILEISFEAEALEPAVHEVHVAVKATSDWAASPPVLSIQDTERFLNIPFSIVLEDAVSDRAFLLKMATPQQRSFLEDKEKCGEISFLNGGGISAMPRLVEPAVAAAGGFSMKRWFMFDSDALQPGVPSAQSEKLRTACIAANVSHHQLTRRSIESYIPIPALESWTYSNGRPLQKVREPVMREFAKLSSSQKHHFNMKDGLAGDSKREGPNAGQLYDELERSVIKVLQVGFGSSVATLFATDIVDENMLNKDGSLSEMRPVLNALIAQVR